jgi:hypothetical protein
METEPYVSGGACFESVGAESGGRPRPALEGSTSRLDMRNARIRAAQRYCRKVESGFGGSLFQANTGQLGMHRFIAIPADYRDIENEHSPTIAKRAQHIAGRWQGACQIYALFMLGFRPASQARVRRGATAECHGMSGLAGFVDRRADWRGRRRNGGITESPIAIGRARLLGRAPHHP